MEYINTNKLEKLNINPNNVYIALDFDRTITTKESQDSWGVVGMFLGQEFNKEIDKLYQKYRPIELDYNITFKNKEKAMIEWYGRCMNLYYKYKLTKEKLEESVKKSKLIFRDGAKELFEKSNKENIQIIILSAGIGNVIEQFLKNNKINLDNIYIIRNFIEFDKDGKMKEFDNSKIIHTLNKTMQGKIPSNIQKRINNIPNKILIFVLRH